MEIFDVNTSDVGCFHVVKIQHFPQKIREIRLIRKIRVLYRVPYAYTGWKHRATLCHFDKKIKLKIHFCQKKTPISDKISLENPKKPTGTSIENR